jgi:Na+-transporting NADH:ubiquinone oxidoreductase subunit C
MSKTETTTRTLAVAGGVAFVCAIMVATAVSVLRPYQLAHASIERNRTILRTASLIESDASVSDLGVVAEYVKLEPRLVDFATGRFTDAADAATYDYESALGDEEALLPIPESADIARIGAKPRLMPLYFSPDTGRVILPFFGRGMWSTISGYLSLESDLNTISGIEVYSHGETAGIGDRIENREWLAGWRGKLVYGPSGELALRIGDPNAAPEHRIDAITGATLTVNGVGRGVLFWLGPDGFGPVIEQLRSTNR